MKTVTTVHLAALGLCLAACSTPQTSAPGGGPAAGATSLPFSSAECIAAKLPPGEPFPAGAIPAAALANRQGGTVAIRYDMVSGAAQNLEVVSSSPTGLYDAAAMQHAAKYRAPTKVNVRGCVTVIEVKF